MAKIIASVFFWLAALTFAFFTLALNFKVGAYIEQHINATLLISAVVVLVFLTIGYISAHNSKKAKVTKIDEE